MIAIILVVIMLAWINGANDNGKGVATLACSGEMSTRSALRFGTVVTFAGALTAIIGGQAMLARFSGKGLVADSVVADPHFQLAAGIGAVVAIVLATWRRLPISTSHALLGGLLGAGFALHADVKVSSLSTVFLLPLIFSPIVAGFLGWMASRSKMTVGMTVTDVTANSTPQVKHSKIAHMVSAGLTSFARGLHDAPKISALILAVPMLGGGANGAILVAVAMALGGWFGGMRVAQRVSTDLCAVAPRQGLGANVACAAMVLAATPLGLPVSTTHVTMGSVAGAALGGSRFDKKLFMSFALAWLVTLPVSAAIAYGFGIAVQRG